MGIINFLKGELIEVISWLDDSGDTLVWRFPDQDHQIKMGAQLTVREGQAAIFVNEGQIADVYQPGLYSLSTQNMPIMTSLRSWKYGFESPFKAEVYFVSTRNFLDLKWGTQNPIMLRDADFGVVRLRAFGTYGIRVTDPKSFVKEIVGTNGLFTTEDIEGQLRSMMVSAFSSLVATQNIAALDLAANYKAISEKSTTEMQPDFDGYGLKLTRFVIENISLPPEVEKMLDTRSQMGIVGNDMAKFTQFQTAQAITDAAKAGGGAGDMMGLGAGIAMGQQMAASMSAAGAAAQQPQAPAATQTATDSKFCSECGKPMPSGSKFCPECGVTQNASCPNCGKDTKTEDKFCKECGHKLK